MSTRKAPSKASIARKLLGFRDISVADYHKDYSAQSKSMLWDFRNRRRIYQAKYVERILAMEPPSRAMELGTLTHAAVLEPTQFPKRYAVYPDDCLNKKGDIVSKPAEAFRDKQRAGMITIKPSELEIVQAMAASVYDKLEPWLALDSHRERPIYWNEPTTGLLCRCLCDWLIVRGGMAYAFDLKTTSDCAPDAFRYKCEDFGYHLADAHYSEGIGSATGLPVEYLFVVVESKYPYATAIQCLADDDRKAAAESRIRLMTDLAQCLKSGNWDESWESQITKLRLRPSCYA